MYVINKIEFFLQLLNKIPISNHEGGGSNGRLSVDATRDQIDAQTFYESLRRTGFGFCLRDHDGNFIQAKTMLVNQLLPVQVGEAMGLLYALEWVAEVAVSQQCFI